MSVLATQDIIVLSRFVEVDEADGNKPVLAWQNYVQPSNISIESGKTANLLENLADDATDRYAEIEETDPFYLEVVTGGAAVNCVGFARHNLPPGSEIKVTVVVGAVEYTSRDWSAIGSRQVIFFIIPEGRPDSVLVHFRGMSSAVRLAVLFVGKTLRFQRKLYVGHTPITFGRRRQIVGGVSESGQLLAPIIRREWVETAISLQHLTPDWYRESLDPWIANGRFAFFAWRPETYPNEVAYVQIVGDPQVSNQLPNGMMQVTINVRGID